MDRVALPNVLCLELVLHLPFQRVSASIDGKSSRADTRYSVNLAKFNTRTRSLNNVLYWLAQIFGAIFMGLFLDTSRLRRSMRARAGWGILFVLTMVIWVCNIAACR